LEPVLRDLGSIEREIARVKRNKPFGIIVEAKGGGARGARLSPESHVIADIAVIGKAAPLTGKAK